MALRLMSVLVLNKTISTVFNFQLCPFRRPKDCSWFRHFELRLGQRGSRVRRSGVQPVVFEDC